jgi:hypothetical protein
MEGKMADVITGIGSGYLGNILNFLAAAGGLGTAAMGLVDTTKVFGGGPSNFGFGYVEDGLKPFFEPITEHSSAFGKSQILQTLRANWLNGVAKADQKAKAKSLLHLGLTRGSARAMAKAAGVDPTQLESLAHKTATGRKVTPEEINVLGQFDVVLSAVLDAAYERGDQKYRNACKALAMMVSTILGGIGGWIVFGAGSLSYFASGDFAFCLLTGALAAPLAPVAKDLASSLQTAVSAVGKLRG